MKHNICLRALKMVVVLGIALSLFQEVALAKIVNSEFFNQAISGSEGPQIVEIDLEGYSAYMLNYYSQGQKTKFRNLTKKEYYKLQGEMQELLKVSTDEKNKDQFCEHEFTYTNVKNEKTINNASICWERLGNKKRAEITQWVIDLRRSLH